MASETPPTVPKTQLIRGRACRNCTGPIPKAFRIGGNVHEHNTRIKMFCCDNCRKEFHKNNGISVHKLKEQVQAWVRQTIKEELAKLGITGRAA